MRTKPCSGMAVVRVLTLILFSRHPLMAVVTCGREMVSPITSHIPEIYSLTNAPMQYSSVRARMVELGWKLDRDDPDDAVLEAIISDSVAPIVACLAPNQTFGRTVYLPLYTTEDPYDAITNRDSLDRPDFNSVFNIAQFQFQNALGAPSVDGKFDVGGHPYRYNVWRGQYAILVLMQDDFDIQFGSEITTWIIECGEEDSLPRLPPHS